MSSQLNFAAPLPLPLPLRRFSVEQYHRLGELGVLTPEDHVELLEGWIVEKMNQRPIHGFIVRLLNEFFLRSLPAGWICQCQLPITTERSEPEPDLAILRGEHARFRSENPRGSDCELIVEVADTSLEKDRAKAAIYRSAGVREYWIINIAAQCLERYLLAASSTASEPELIAASSSVTMEIGGTQLLPNLQQLFGHE